MGKHEYPLFSFRQGLNCFKETQFGTKKLVSLPDSIFLYVFISSPVPPTKKGSNYAKIEKYWKLFNTNVFCSREYTQVGLPDIDFLIYFSSKRRVKKLLRDPCFTHSYYSDRSTGDDLRRFLLVAM